MKTLKHFLMLGLFGMISLGASAEVYSGSCGNNAKWSLDTSTGLLSITGSGDMAKYYDLYHPTPWSKYQSNIKLLSIGDQITSIGRIAFEGCSGLTSVTIPNSVTSIGERAFWGCDNVESIFWDSNVTPTFITSYCREKLTSVTIGNSVTSIGYRAFSGCSGLTSVTIGNSVTSIGDYAFAYCSGLTSVTIPNSVTSIGKCAFSECSGLTSVTIPNSVTSIGYEAFWYCLGLTSVTIGNSVTEIGSYAFSGCSGLTSVTIPNSVTSIGSYAFEYCSGLTSVTIGNSVTSIGSFAFSYCSGLTNVNITDLDKWAEIEFKNYNANPLYYAHNLYLNGQLVKDAKLTTAKKIGSCAFHSCSGLTSVTIPNSVTSIGSEAFKGCSNVENLFWDSNVTPSFITSYCREKLKSVEIGNSVTTIGNYAFYSCSGLTSVTIPNSVTSIGDWAFYWCPGLTSVTIPNSVTSIGNRAFSSCSGLTSIAVESGNKVYDSRGNCNAIIETARNTLISGCKNTIIPNSVTSIGAGAFQGCSGLTSVTIPNSVTSIGEDAFYIERSSLTSVYVEWNNADKIPVLTSSYDFPYSTCDLYVPTGTKTIYQGKDYWNTFKNIFEYDPTSVLLGDANNDGNVNVNDITTIATYILNGKVAPWNEKNADANEDGSINVNDITDIADIILNGEGGEDSHVYLKCPDGNHPHAIDLGLPSGTKWCCCNVGATTPEGYGGYYAWGETSEKSVYFWDTYAYYNSSTGEYNNIGSDIADTQYDVARIEMGAPWYMPSHEQQAELIDKCTRIWTQRNGVYGILLTGENGGQIFLPAAGFRSVGTLSSVGSNGEYWSSSLWEDQDYVLFPPDPKYACHLGFSSNSWNSGLFTFRYFGYSVRAVCP